MKTLSIGQVAKQAGVGIETIRFYEREGVLGEPDRKLSGYPQVARFWKRWMAPMKVTSDLYSGDNHVSQRIQDQFELRKLRRGGDTLSQR